MKGSTVIKAVVIILASVFFLNQIISAVYKPIVTETAEFVTSNDGFKITGIIMRNEILVENKNNGVLHFMVEDGTRVAKNGVIANIYSNETASITLSEIENIKKKINDIENILSFNDIEAANIDLVNSRISQDINNMIFSSSSGDFSEIPYYSEELLSSLNRKQAVLGNVADFSSQLELLNSQLTTLSSSLPNAKGTIIAEESGYFVSKIDGFEKVLNCDDLSKITPEFLSDISSKDESENVIGKIVSDYEWYISAEVTINQSLNFKEGDSLKIYTSVKSSPVLPVTVKKINISENNSKAVIVFACNEMNSELAAMRSGPMTVVSKEYSGLRVSKKALRVVDSVRGVYVLNGIQVNFVPVKIVYSNDAFIICEKQNTDDNVLKLYDQVVVKGKKLYDGKIVG